MHGIWRNGFTDPQRTSLYILPAYHIVSPEGISALQKNVFLYRAGTVFRSGKIHLTGRTSAAGN